MEEACFLFSLEDGTQVQKEWSRDQQLIYFEKIAEKGSMNEIRQRVSCNQVYQRPFVS